MKKIRHLILLLILPFMVQGQEYSAWVDSTYARMTMDEKIGQMMMIRAFSKNEDGHYQKTRAIIEKYKPGGICFFQGDPAQQAQQVNIYQVLSEIPMMVAIDGEWGVGMRFPKSVISFPKQLMLGAIQDENLIYEMGKEVALQCKTLGIHINFAPDIDVNNNPLNPVINVRSFGEDIYNVAAKGFAYMKGMQDHGVYASAKHFPGHGDTDVDSHHDMPVINHTLDRLDSLELMPFQVLIDQGIKSVMIAHMQVPALDDRPNRPTTLSDKVVTNLLRDKMGFDGLVFTDAMEMQGVLKHFPSGIAEAEAVVAGNDFILLPMDIGLAVETIKKYIREGKITEDRIAVSVKKILQEKYNLGIHEKATPLKPTEVYNILNRPETTALKSRLIRDAITLVSDDQDLLPIKNIAPKSIATLSIGHKGSSPFQKRLSDYAEIAHFSVGKEIGEQEKTNLLSALKTYQTVIVSFHDMSRYASKGFGISQQSRDFLDILEKQNSKVVKVIFGSPYSLQYFEGKDAIVVAYEEDKLVQDLTAQAIFGASYFRGKLPVTIGGFNYGTGIQKEGIGRLGYDVPESVGMSSDSLAAIDTIINEMINRQAAPGCQILIAKDGKIIFDKVYGHYTYKKKQPVTSETIYDVASVTKVMASTVSLMHLYDEGKFKLSDRVSKYISQLDTTNKKDVAFEEMLAHHAKFIGWIPFYTQTVTKDRRNPRPKEEYYKRRGSSDFSIQVARNLFMRTDYRDSIWSRIYGSKLRELEGYRYSDLAFYLAAQSIQNMSALRVNDYAGRHFYHPLGLTRTTFNPLAKFKPSEIAPSEEDIYFRRQRIQGHVHDMGAAMLGGISGHAGLFSTSKDLAILGQMLINDGYYGGKQFLEPTTIERFTTRYSRSTRRGLGFDMKELNTSKSLNMSEKASISTFGHLGFTGTAVFCDPEHNLVYIFLSNRTYPRMTNNKFSRYEYRPRVQTVMYNALLKETLP